MRTFVFIALLLAATAAVTSAAAAAESTTVSQTVPFTATVTNTCNGDEVLLTGQIHTVDHITLGQDGHINSSKKTTVQATGVTLTGAKYQNSSEQHEMFNSRPAIGPFEETFSFREKLVRQGETGALPDDFFVVFHVHVTINANGVPTSDVFVSEERCA